MAQAMLAAQLGKPKEIDMGKYARMKRIGMPMASILNKMRLEGVSEDQIAQFSGGGAARAQKEKKQEKNIMEIKPQTKMKPFHWTKLNQFQVAGTIWEGVDQVIQKYKINYPEVEGFFQQYSRGDGQAKWSGGSKPEAKEDAPKQPKSFQLLDHQRAANVESYLVSMARKTQKRQKVLSEDDILEAVLRLDDSVLDVGAVMILKAHVPTDAELQMVREYVKEGGDVSKLGRAEQFFVKMMDLVDIKSRLDSWIFKSEFPTRIVSVKERIARVNTAMETIMNNLALKDVLTILLAIGNYMNSGSMRGNAYGFHLTPALELLDGMKEINAKSGSSKDPQMSLTMYLVKACQDCKNDSLQWVTQLELLQIASKVSSDKLQQEVDEIRREMNDIDKKHKVQKRTLTQTHIDWSRDGAAVPLNQIAAHFRVVSRTMDKESLQEEYATYKTLRMPVRPGMGAGGKIGGIGGMQVGASYGGGPMGHSKNDSIASTVSDDGNDDVENMFGKLMLQFYKRANATVREVETSLKQLSQNTKKLCTFFGADENTKSEDILGTLNDFRQNFIKAQGKLKEWENAQKKKEAKKQAVATVGQQLANRSKKEDVKYLQGQQANAAQGQQGGKGMSKSQQMYMAKVKGKTGGSAKERLAQKKAQGGKSSGGNKYEF